MALFYNEKTQARETAPCSRSARLSMVGLGFEPWQSGSCGLVRSSHQQGLCPGEVPKIASAGAELGEGSRELH